MSVRKAILTTFQTCAFRTNTIRTRGHKMALGEWHTAAMEEDFIWGKRLICSSYTERVHEYIRYFVLVKTLSWCAFFGVPTKILIRTGICAGPKTEKEQQYRSTQQLDDRFYRIAPRRRREQVVKRAASNSSISMATDRRNPRMMMRSVERRQGEWTSKESWRMETEQETQR